MEEPVGLVKETADQLIPLLEGMLVLTLVVRIAVEILDWD
ncbi:hypothetical protein BH18THE2_BH18THE2_18260 [soil metagenome]